METRLQARLRPRLFGSALLASLVFAVLPRGWDANTRLLIAWNIGVVCYLVLAWIMAVRSSTARMQERAAEEDEGAVVVLMLTLGAAVASLGAIAVELHGTGVHVTALLPGWVRTEFHERAGISGSSIPSFMWLSPERVVEEALDDVARGKVLSMPTKRYRLLGFALRHLPRSAVRRISGLVASARQKERAAGS